MPRKHFWPVGISGVAIAILFALALALLPKEFAEDALIAVTGLLGGVYFGVGLSSASVKNMAMNFAMATIFLALALAGAWVSPMFFALAFFMHAAWDFIIDHPKMLNEPIAQWYMPICIGADIFLGAFILIRWW